MAKDDPALATATPHYHGHRDRLRQRLLATGGDGMPDYEILELLLTTVIPRRDVKPLAKRLIERFGSLGETVSAPVRDLEAVSGLGPAAVAALKIVQVAGLRLASGHICKTEIIASWDRLIDYCKAAMGYERVEQLRILFLDRKNVLIADEIQQRGTVDHTPLYPREVVKRALELNASALIVVHNHPSGDPTPSRGDIEMTKELRDIADKLGIALHDHVVIGKNRHASFRSMGLL